MDNNIQRRKNLYRNNDNIYGGRSNELFFLADFKGDEIDNYNAQLKLAKEKDEKFEFNYGLSPAYREDKGAWGYIDELYEEVIECKYYKAEPFVHGLAVIKQKTADGVKSGCIDIDGKEILKCEYDLIIVDDMCIRIKKEDKWACADKKGEILSGFFYDTIGRFNSGYSLIRKNGKWGYMNERLIEVIPCMYEDAWPIKDGVAEVKENGEWKKIKIEELDMLDKRKEKYRSLLARRKTYRQIKEHYNMDR